MQHQRNEHEIQTRNNDRGGKVKDAVSGYASRKNSAAAFVHDRLAEGKDASDVSGEPKTLINSLA
jgi:hypothetical protein